MQSHDDLDLTASRGVAVREFPMKYGFGRPRSRPGAIRENGQEAHKGEGLLRREPVNRLLTMKIDYTNSDGIQASEKDDQRECVNHLMLRPSARNGRATRPS